MVGNNEMALKNLFLAFYRTVNEDKTGILIKDHIVNIDEQVFNGNSGFGCRNYDF